MHSRPEYCTPHGLLALTLTTVLAAAPLRAAPPPAGEVPSTEQIAAAVKAIRQDPNLGAPRTERTLRWVNSRPRKVRHGAAWLEWIFGLFGWFAKTSRFLFWGAVAVLAGFLAIFLVRLVRERRTPGASADRFTAPTHVRDLDIRPESLPDDIGAAARQLWQAGQRRAALALLYRGLISRLVHVYGVPIRGSSTEGECLALAARRLDESPQRYASRLVRIWQLAVYGGHEPASDAIFALCDEFAGALPSRMPAGAGGAT